MAKVVGILGSPLTEGNTAILLHRALKGAEDAGCTVEEIDVVNLDFEACKEMFFCREHETCIMDDDMQQMYEKIKSADSIILATPVMTMGIPGKLKSFIDRFQVFFMAKYIRNCPLVEKERIGRRRGLFICISGMAVPEVFVGVRLTVQAFFDIIDCKYSDELLINDMDRIRDLSTRCDLLDAAYNKGLMLGRALSRKSDS
ncbi:flavodoxin family protein [uncultured Methanoregula sp.]|uniref:flavodoxin family protein n=1 Tax=uncultured Methanoregula sp. TaxID=1005933 RepID=UPI002AAA6E6C|nr:flavodoxin family protein [uncultured Methanoregula sp.]